MVQDTLNTCVSPELGGISSLEPNSIGMNCSETAQALPGNGCFRDRKSIYFPWCLTMCWVLKPVGLKTSLSAANTGHGSPRCRKRTDTRLSFPFLLFFSSLELRTCNHEVTSQTLKMRRREISPPNAEFATGGAPATGSCPRGTPWARMAREG